MLHLHTDALVEKSLAITLRKILDELPYTPDGQIAVDAQLRTSLEDAVELYTSSRQEALTLLYKNKEFAKAGSVQVQADFEEVAASCGYFSFSLLDLANETKKYLEILDDLKLEVEDRPYGRSWKWLKFWGKIFPFKSMQINGDPGKTSADVSSSLVELASPTNPILQRMIALLRRTKKAKCQVTFPAQRRERQKWKQYPLNKVEDCLSGTEYGWRLMCSAAMMSNLASRLALERHCTHYHPSYSRHGPFISTGAGNGAYSPTC